jgi:hypothetical protein
MNFEEKLLRKNLTIIAEKYGYNILDILILWDYLKNLEKINDVCELSRKTNTSPMKTLEEIQSMEHHMSTKPPEAKKFDEGKLRYDLIPAYPLEQLAKVYTMGAIKYGDRNWENGLSFSRVFAAMLRHFWSWVQGEDNDTESGLNHMAHVAWGCFALIEFQKRKTGEDDRQKYNF